MLSWLFGSKPASKLASKPLEVRPLVNFPAEMVLPGKLPNQDCILAIDPAKGSDKLITVYTTYPKTTQQYIRRRFGEWFSYPSLRKREDWLPLEGLLESFELQKVYGSELEPLSFAIKARKSAIRCVYCHLDIVKMAQTCLQCGSFVCLPCAPSLDGCPIPGCGND